MLLVLVTLLAVACVFDAATHRVPNALAVGVAATGIVSQSLAGGSAAVLSGVAALLASAAVLWPAWARRWIGGGDLKLAAAAATWLGLARVPSYLLLSAVAVGAVSAVCYALSASAARAEVRRNLAVAARGIAVSAPIGASPGRVQVPAGIGFALGALAVISGVGGL